MIRRLFSISEHRAFIEGFINDPIFSDPHFAFDENNLWGALQKKDHRVFGAFRDETLTGLFVFLLIEEEKYAEMIVGLSRDEAALAEMLQYLSETCRGFSADFVINPRNRLLRMLLSNAGASFEKEQRTLVWKTETALTHRHDIKLFSDEYKDQYLNMHTQNVYWTGERVLAAPDKFRVLLAVKGPELIGYLDVTHCYKINEPYDLRVKPQYAGQGCEREMLLHAIGLNQPNGMTAVIDADDEDALSIFRSAGFEPLKGLDSLTAHAEIR